MDTLDVRPMPPRVRHETIERLDALGTGETRPATLGELAALFNEALRR